VSGPGAALAAAVALVACMSAACAADGPDVDVTAELAGTFSAEFGPGTTLGGNEFPDSSAEVTWVARSVCRDTGCVATVTEVAPGDTGGLRPPSPVFDFIDGHWVSVREVPSECVNSRGETITVQGWQTYVLAPRSDGVLVGTYTNRSSVGGACHNSTQTVTLTRTGDGDPDVDVADPASQPARVSSPASALWGAYRQVQTNPQTGQVYPPTNYSGNTQCLRSGERCLSYLVDPDSKAILVMTFAQGQWTSTSAPVDSPCPDGSAAESTLTGEFALPQPLSDPITKLTGTQRTLQTGRCPGALIVDVALDRTGDGTGRAP
jgi:serine/threonine-protein kinase